MPWVQCSRDLPGHKQRSGCREGGKGFCYGVKAAKDIVIQNVSDGIQGIEKFNSWSGL